MNCPDNQEWAEACQKKFQGFKDRGVFATVRPPKGAKILGTTTRLDYKIDNCVLDNRRAACEFLGIINWKTASMLLIYILPF